MLHLMTVSDMEKLSYCLNNLNADDVIVLSSEGVNMISQLDHKYAGTMILALSDSVLAFGLKDKADRLGIRCIDYSTLVQLTVEIGSPKVWK